MSVFSIGSKSPKLPSSDKYWIADSATVIGDVKLREQTSIWFGATVRGDNEKILVGYGSNIQENCVLHNDVGHSTTIGENCTVGHGAILHGCSIGNNCIIGMGAIILNGAKIGENCIVGAGALITEEKAFLDAGKLILGSPARVVRDLKEDDIDNIIKSALIYQSKFLAFKHKINKIEN